MNVFHKVALQGLKKNRTRTFVTIIGVALSAALFTAVATFGTSLLQYLVRGSSAKYGGWYVEFVDVDAGFVQQRGADAEVTQTTAFENIGYAVLDGAKSPEKPYLFVAGFGADAFDELPVTLISGRLPENDTEVLVPNHVAMKAGVQLPVGECLSLALGSRTAGGQTLTQHDPYTAGETLTPTAEKRYTVVGTYDRAGFEEHEAPGYTLITKVNGQAPAGRYSLFVTLKSPRQARAYAKGLAEPGAYLLNEDVLRFYGVTDNALFNMILLSVGGVVIAIIMVGSIFLIYNAFNISLNERTHQFGILMSVGATAKQLRNSVLFEGFCIGLLGIPLGILVGVGGVALLLPVVASSFSVTFATGAIPLTLCVSAPALGAAVIVSFVTILLSAYLPAKKAAATPVMQCILQTGEIKTEARAVRISPLALRVYGLEGTLALKNFRRNRHRYRSVVLSLTLSVVLFVSGGAFGTTLKQIAKSLISDTADGDVLFYTQDMEETSFFALYDKVLTAPGVYKGAWQTDCIYTATTQELPAGFTADARQSTEAGSEPELSVYLQFIPDDIYYNFIQTLGHDPADYTGDNAKFLAVLMDPVQHVTFFTGSDKNFTLHSADGAQSLTVCAALEDHYPLDPLPKDADAFRCTYLLQLVAPWSLKAQFDTLGPADQMGWYLWSATPSQTVVEAQAAITEAGLSGGYTLFNSAAMFDLFRSQTFVVDVFTYSFVGMLSLIAVANVFNTISTNIRLRRRELAMLRSVGMSEQGFNRMMNFECFFYGLQTLLFGVPLATLSSWLISRVVALGEELDNFPYTFPWQSMTISVLGVFCIVFITMLYATSKIKRENIIDALRDEMS